MNILFGSHFIGPLTGKQFQLQASDIAGHGLKKQVILSTQIVELA